MDTGSDVRMCMKKNGLVPAHGGRSKSKKGGANPVAVQAYLKGMTYPARKQDILDRAAENEAPDEIIAALEKISDREYGSPAELTREAGQAA